jgi:hypothetical protein
MLLAAAATLIAAGVVFLVRNKPTATGACLVASIVPALLAGQTSRPAGKVDVEIFGGKLQIEYQQEAVNIKTVPGGQAATERAASQIVRRADPDLSTQSIDAFIKALQPAFKQILWAFHMIALPEGLQAIGVGDIVKIFDDGDIRLVLTASTAFGSVKSSQSPTDFPKIKGTNADKGPVYFECQDATVARASQASFFNTIKTSAKELLADPQVVVVQSVFRCENLVVDIGVGPRTFHNVAIGFIPINIRANVLPVTKRD